MTKTRFSFLLTWKYRTPVHNMLSWKYSFSQRNCYDLEVPWCCSIQNKTSWVCSIFSSESSIFWEHSCENLYSETSARDINPLCSSYSYKLLRNWPKKENCLRTLCYNHFSTQRENRKSNPKITSLRQAKSAFSN